MPTYEVLRAVPVAFGVEADDPEQAAAIGTARMPLADGDRVIVRDEDTGSVAAVLRPVVTTGFEAA